MMSPKQPQNGETTLANGKGTERQTCLPNPATLEQVVETELRDVANRRQAAGFDPDHSGDVKDNLAGLALSGGGVRSASFNLGLLQALVASGVLRFIDYLSTVSGGGYIGSYLDSLAYRRHTERGQGDKKSPPSADALEPIRPLANGGQPPEVMALVANSHYLNDTVGFVNRYLIGLVLFNLTLFLGVLFLATVMATLWRLLDTPPIVNYLLWVSNGYLLEWNRPFLPGVLLLLVWMLIWIGSFVRTGTPALAKHSGLLLFFAGAFLLIGFATWLGTPNMNFTNVIEPNFDPRKQQLRHWPSQLFLPLGILLVLALLPWLRPREVLKSGVQKESFWRQWVFKIAGVALLVGIPFAAVYWAGRHNISGIASGWDRPLNSADFLNWETLVGKMKDEAAKREAEPNLEMKQSLVTPGTLFYEQQTQTESPNEKAALARLRDANKASQYRRADPNGDPWPFRSWGPWIQSYHDYIAEEEEKTDTAYWMTDVLKTYEFTNALLGTTEGRNRVRDRLAELRKIPQGDEEADWLEQLLDYLDFRSTHEVQDAYPPGFKPLAAGHVLLRAFYPNEFRPVHFISRPIVICDDQWWRLRLIVCTALAFLLTALCINFNLTSMHGFYRSRLQRTFIVPTRTATDGKKRDIFLGEIKNTDEGLPYHLLLGSVEVASGRGLLHKRSDSFLFSRRYCGSHELGFCPTDKFRNGDNELSSAAAISGAAVSPLRMGNLLFQILLVVTNFRLGQWLPNPGRPAPWMPKFVPLLRLLFDWIGHRPTRKEKFVFVADGGFYENLGFEALLDRRCRVMIVSDAGADPHFVFEDFGRLFRRCRMKGIRLLAWGANQDLTMQDVIPSGLPGRGLFSKQHRVFGRVIYPDGEEGLFVYVKLSMSDPEIFDLWQYRQTHPTFPHDPTVNQFFDVDQFESYRELGFRIGAKLCEDLQVNQWEEDQPITVEALQPIVDRLTCPAAPSSPDSSDLVPSEKMEPAARLIPAKG
jgi:hypothetical protein